MIRENGNFESSDWRAVQTADGSWTLAHNDHSEWYHSADGARSEARDLYIHSSGILDFFRDGSSLQVLDVGLGLGYNAIATLDAWAACGKNGRLNLVSVENDAVLFAALRSGEAPWQQGWSPQWLSWVECLEPTSDGHWQAAVGDKGTWRVVVADALAEATRDFVARAGLFDFVWQDPFSPEKNPTMWGGDWFSFLGSVTRADGILMTYSVARPVRDALQDNGWRVEKIPTTTRKKNWLKAFRLALPGEPT